MKILIRLNKKSGLGNVAGLAKGIAKSAPKGSIATPAITGALTGAVRGAMQKDENGNRKGLTGAVGGAIGGAALGAAGGYAGATMNKFNSAQSLGNAVKMQYNSPDKVKNTSEINKQAYDEYLDRAVKKSRMYSRRPGSHTKSNLGAIGGAIGGAALGAMLAPSINNKKFKWHLAKKGNEETYYPVHRFGSGIIGSLAGMSLGKSIGGAFDLKKNLKESKKEALVDAIYSNPITYIRGETGLDLGPVPKNKTSIRKYVDDLSPEAKDKLYDTFGNRHDKSKRYIKDYTTNDIVAPISKAATGSLLMRGMDRGYFK